MRIENIGARRASKERRAGTRPESDRGYTIGRPERFRETLFKGHFQDAGGVSPQHARHYRDARYSSGGKSIYGNTAGVDPIASRREALE